MNRALACENEYSDRLTAAERHDGWNNRRGDRCPDHTIDI